MITKLADKWRTENRQSGWSYESDKADELEAALPKWTRITEDESTWPEPADVVMLCTGFDSANKPYLSVRMIGADAIACYKSLIWRPLCDLDYPPEQES